MKFFVGLLIGFISAFIFAFTKVASGKHWQYLAQLFYDYSYKISSITISVIVVIIAYYLINFVMEILNTNYAEAQKKAIERDIQKAEEHKQEAIRIKSEAEEYYKKTKREADNIILKAKREVEQYKEELVRRIKEKN